MYRRVFKCGASRRSSGVRVVFEEVRVKKRDMFADDEDENLSAS